VESHPGDIASFRMRHVAVCLILLQDDRLLGVLNVMSFRGFDGILIVIPSQIHHFILKESSLEGSRFLERN